MERLKDMKRYNYMVYILEDDNEFYFFEGKPIEICRKLNISKDNLKKATMRGRPIQGQYKIYREVLV